MLIRQTILYLPAQIAGPLFQFLAAIVWTFWLMPEAYGVLAYVMAMQELAFVICLAWWSHYTLRYAGTLADPAEQVRFQQVETATLLVSSLLQIGVCIVTLSLQGIALTVPMVGATLLYVITRSITNHLGERARAAGHIGLYTVGQTIGPVFGFGLAFALVSRLSATPEHALLGFGIAHVVGLVWLWQAMGLRFAIARPDGVILRRALRFGVPLVVAGVIAWVSTNGIRNIVQYDGGHEAVGLVSVGWALGQRLASFVAMLVTAAAFPLAVRYLQAGQKEKALHQLALNGAVLFGLLAPSTFGLLMIAHPAVQVLIAPPFQAVTLAVLPLATLGGAIRNLRVHMSDQVLILFERTDLCVMTNVIEAVVTVVGCIVGLHLGGLVGAVAGTVFGFVTGAAFSFGYAILGFGLQILWDVYLRIGIATAAMSAVLWIMPEERMASAPWTQIAIGIGAGGLVYVTSLLILFPRAIGEMRAKVETLRRRAA
jgi:O-antigen/teichoic acid export membrane protein